MNVPEHPENFHFCLQTVPYVPAPICHVLVPRSQDNPTGETYTKQDDVGAGPERHRCPSECGRVPPQAPRLRHLLRLRPHLGQPQPHFQERRVHQRKDVPILGPGIYIYRVVQLDFTPENEVFCMLFDRTFSMFTMTEHIRYSNFRFKIQLDHRVLMLGSP